MIRSLSARLILFSVFWIALALLGTGAIIIHQYKVHIEQYYDAHLHSHLEEVIGAVEPDGRGGARLARPPTDPRFYRDGSGWYWAVLRGEELLASSGSLGTRRLDVARLSLNEGPHVLIIEGPDDQSLRAHITHVAMPGDLGFLTFVSSAPAMTISDNVADFSGHIGNSLLVLGAGLLAALLFQVLIVMRPIRSIRERIAEVRAGNIERLPADYPEDLQPLVDELNHVLDHNETLLRRARNHMADLAHALKNPLTVIRNAARDMRGEESKLILDQSHLMAASIDNALAHARMHAHGGGLARRTGVQSVLEDVRFAVEQMYRDRDLEILLQDCDEACFRGEPQDLEQMIGNLVDNACKWAEATVTVGCHSDGGTLRILVDDDGPGIDEANHGKVRQRGVRLDEATPGHGHGLAIVRELAELYDGELVLTRSATGGLHAELILPAA
ncbi:MAG: hypothetical protein KGY81_04730 [Phycisphaerae bacterium]|nr:hypothetical protein [Phycisphaerae bacterium]